MHLSQYIFLFLIEKDSFNINENFELLKLSRDISWFIICSKEYSSNTLPHLQLTILEFLMIEEKVNKIDDYGNILSVKTLYSFISFLLVGLYFRLFLSKRLYFIFKNSLFILYIRISIKSCKLFSFSSLLTLFSTKNPFTKSESSHMLCSIIFNIAF